MQSLAPQDQPFAYAVHLRPELGRWESNSQRVRVRSAMIQATGWGVFVRSNAQNVSPAVALTCLTSGFYPNVVF